MAIELRTKRLLLRPIRPGDETAVQQHCQDYDIARYMLHVPHPYTDADAVDFVNRASQKKGRVWAITHADDLIGMVGTVRAFGYWVGKPYWRQGFATEAAIAALDHYFTDPLKCAIKASHMKENVASGGLLRNFGFEITGEHEMKSIARPAAMPGYTLMLSKARWERRRNA